MTQNILVLCSPGQDALTTGLRVTQEAVRRAGGGPGDALGLVNTCLAPEEMLKTGSRIEQERHFGALAVSALDEPLGVGAAVAQLAGFADAVLVARLDDWAGRLHAHYGDRLERIEEEIAGVTSILSAGLCELVLLSRPVQGTGPVATLYQRMLREIEPRLTATVQ